MGGAAFANAYAPGRPSLRVRRITSAEYKSLVEIWRSKVQAFFVCSQQLAQSPVPAPEKTTFGDIDILVGMNSDVDWLDMASKVGAAAVIKRGRRACSLAVLPAGDGLVTEAALYHDCQGHKMKLAEDLSSEEYIQVDVQLVEPDLLAWTCFADSYGDTAIILGYIISRFGFTQNDKGFWLRVKELDELKTVSYLAIPERDGMILLTTYPSELMNFLGLSIEQFDNGFETMDDYYGWLSQCRLLVPELLHDDYKKADLIRRERKRPIYTDFFFDWLPNHPEASTASSWINNREKIEDVRAEVLPLTLKFFNVGDRYEEARQRILKQWQHGHAVYLLRQMVKAVTGKNDDYVSLVLRGMRRHVVFVDDQAVIHQEAHSDSDSELASFLDNSKQQLQSPDRLQAWLETRESELRSLGKTKHRSSAAGA